jgi:hypothetical protein
MIIVVLTGINLSNNQQNNKLISFKTKYIN